MRGDRGDVALRVIATLAVWISDAFGMWIALHLFEVVAVPETFPWRQLLACLIIIGIVTRKGE